MKMLIHRRVAAVPALLLLLAGCSVRQDVYLSISGVGTAEGEIGLHRVFISYLEDLAMVFGETENLPLFDFPAIEAAFAKSPGVELVALSSPRRETLRFSLKFADLNAPFEASPPVEKNILEFRREGRQRRLKIVLSRENFSQIAAYFPLMDAGLMASLTPRGHQTVAEEDYKDDLSYALEDYLGNTSIEEVLKASSVRIAIDVEGALKEQRGGRVEGSRVVFTVPLLKILVLNEPLEYSLTFLP